MYKEIIDKIKPELEKAVSFLERELTKIRVGRATSSLIEDIEVECFGKIFPLKQLVLISIPEPKQILIQPWDKSYIEPIMKALSEKNQSFSLVVDKDLIRINLPPMSEEFRKNLIQTVSQIGEQAKKTIRRFRDEVWSEIQEKTREGKIREDDKYKGKEELQDLIDEYNEKIENLIENKKKEIME